MFKVMLRVLELVSLSNVVYSTRSADHFITIAISLHYVDFQTHSLQPAPTAEATHRVLVHGAMSKVM